MTVFQLPALEELLASVRVVAIPLAVRFRGLSVREAVIVEGPRGPGEFAPFVEYDDGESAPWLASAVEAGWAGWPAPVRQQVPVNATVPAVAADAVAGVLARFDGCTTAKVKVAERGQSLEDDVDRVAAVRSALGTSGRVRVDANGAWTVAEATAALTRLSAFDLEYAEQPCASVSELRQLRMSLARNGVDVPIAADESIRKAADPIEVARLRRRTSSSSRSRRSAASVGRSRSSRSAACRPSCPPRSTPRSGSRRASRSPRRSRAWTTRAASAP